MFFDVGFVLRSIAAAKHEAEYVKKRCEHMTPEQAEAWREARKQAATDERRHQELCAAIKEAGRRASFW